MNFAHWLAGGAVAIALAMGFQPADAAERRKCLNAEERRGAVTSHRAMTLSGAVRAAKPRLRGEIVRARLCEQGPALVYVLTVLGRDGKVTRVTIAATPGSTAGRGGGEK